MLRITECPRSRGSTRLGRLRFHAEICSICFLFACKSSKKKKKGNCGMDLHKMYAAKKRYGVVVSSKHFHTFSYFFIRRESEIKMTFAGSLFSNTMNNLYRLRIEKRIFFFFSSQACTDDWWFNFIYSLFGCFWEDIKGNWKFWTIIKYFCGKLRDLFQRSVRLVVI